MKKIILLVFVFLVTFVLGGFWFYKNAQPASSSESFQDFLIVKGSGASLIGNNLEKGGFIKNALTFKMFVQVTGASSKIQAGEYRLSPDMSLFEIVGQLLKGPSEIWVTIPEGLRKEEIATRFATALGKDDSFRTEFLQAAAAHEGYLFPDTYLFPKTAEASVIVNKLVSTFEAKTKDLGLTRDEVILASIIERETKTDEERPIVSGILNNRLDVGMALQVDATIQYAKGNWEPIFATDKSFNSPYNTYKYAGLPPGPISNPGLSSLKAAADPTTTGYFYYLHDAKGKIYYAKTLEEHNSNIRKYL